MQNMLLGRRRFLQVGAASTVAASQAGMAHAGTQQPAMPNAADYLLEAGVQAIAKAHEALERGDEVDFSAEIRSSLHYVNAASVIPADTDALQPASFIVILNAIADMAELAQSSAQDAFDAVNEEALVWWMARYRDCMDAAIEVPYAGRSERAIFKKLAAFRIGAEYRQISFGVEAVAPLMVRAR